MEMFSIPVAIFAIALLLCIFLGVLIGMTGVGLALLLADSPRKIEKVLGENKWKRQSNKQ